MSLSSADIDHLETVLSQGKKPKVMFTESAGQVAGRAGKVVELAQPREGDFVVVAFGSDQLPFSPGELRLPARGESSKAAKAPAKAPRQRDRGPAGPALLEPEKPRPRTKTTRTASERQPVSDQSEPSTDETKPAAPRKRAPRQRAAAKHPELTVTLTYEDGSWAVAAAKGARTVVKGAEVSHTAALAMCDAAESEEVAGLVAEVVERIRAEAAEEAERLRRQLKDAEARLAELGR